MDRDGAAAPSQVGQGLLHAVAFGVGRGRAHAREMEEQVALGGGVAGTGGGGGLPVGSRGRLDQVHRVSAALQVDAHGRRERDRALERPVALPVVVGVLREPGGARVEEHQRARARPLLLLPHHELAVPGGGAPVHAAERIPRPVLARAEVVLAAVGAALHALGLALGGDLPAGIGLEVRQARRHDEARRAARDVPQPHQAERVVLLDGERAHLVDPPPLGREVVAEDGTGRRAAGSSREPPHRGQLRGRRRPVGSGHEVEHPGAWRGHGARVRDGHGHGRRRARLHDRGREGALHVQPHPRDHEPDGREQREREEGDADEDELAAPRDEGARERGDPGGEQGYAAEGRVRDGLDADPAHQAREGRHGVSASVPRRSAARRWRRRCARGSR